MPSSCLLVFPKNGETASFSQCHEGVLSRYAKRDCDEEPGSKVAAAQGSGRGADRRCSQGLERGSGGGGRSVSELNQGPDLAQGCELRVSADNRPV